MRQVVRTALLGAVAAWGGCGEAPPARDCRVLVWAQPQVAGARLAVIGSWDGWVVPGIPLEASAEPGWQVARIDGGVEPGEYGYLVLEDGVHRIDQHNPRTTFWTEQDDLEVSLMIVPDCGVPVLTVDSVEVGYDTLKVSASFATAEDGSPLKSATATGAAGSVPVVVDGRGNVELSLTGLPRGKHSLVISSEDGAGRTAQARVSAFVQPAAQTWADGLLYQIVTDRYRGPGGVALAPPATAGSRAGGTLDGITAEIEAGTFTDMGVTALWISPVYTNPDEAREGRGDGHMYEGYHGYWVADPRGVDPKIGGEAALERMIAAAHERGLRVLLDVVPNHVYETSPRYTERPAEEWFNRADPPCVCGLGTCDWGSFIQTCWFTDYLPDLRLQEPAALKAVYEDLIWWNERFDVDGLRVDAVPMMPRAATRRMAHELRASVSGEAPFLIGEVFTGAGSWGVDVIRYYLGAEGLDGLDSVFDFPLMWAIRDALAHESVGFGEVEAMLLEIEASTAGSGAVLGRIVGNHDVPRFFSVAHGDAGGDPWAAPAVQADDPIAFARQRSALTLLLTLPGLPVLYYGDEIGLAGSNDPDNRRVFPAEEALSAEQTTTRGLVQRLGRLRACLPALRGGEREVVILEDTLYGFRRGSGEGAALVLLSSSAGAQTVQTPPMGLGTYVDAIGGERFEFGPDGASVPLEPRQPRVLVRADSGCVPAR